MIVFFTKYWKSIVFLVVVLLSVYIGYMLSNSTWEKKYLEMQNSLTELQLKNEKLKTESNRVTVEEVTKYVDRVRIVKEQSEEIIREIPIYITAEDNANCIIPDDFIRLHNKAANHEYTIP